MQTTVGETFQRAFGRTRHMFQKTSKLRDKEPQTLEDTCRKARGNWVTSRLRFFCQRKWMNMKHCCLQGSLRVWSWSCSSCLRDLRSWRARDWGDKGREQLGEPSKEPILQQKPFATKTPRRWTRQIAPRTLYILTMAEGLTANVAKETSQVNSCEFRTPMFVIDIQILLKRPPLDGKLRKLCFFSVIFAFFLPNHAGKLKQKVVSAVLDLNKNLSRS